jgi:two-component system sensor kinase FixL
MHPWFAAPEVIGGIVLFSEDVTERYVAAQQAASLREQLAHASRVGTMGELAAGIAHELNQPLMAVHMYAQTAVSLRQRSNGAAEMEQKVDESLVKVAEQSLRAGEIVQRMRAFIGKRQPQLAECRVNELVSDVLDLLNSPLATGNINVRLDLADSLPEVRVDSIQIQQVLVNLIQNAIDAMSAIDEQPRDLSLGTRLENGDVVVTVADNGPGLSEGAMRQVFDPFHSTKPAGMGLGLPICRTLVEAHGGTIAVRSNRDRGAVFEFRLPVLMKGRKNG